MNIDKMIESQKLLIANVEHSVDEDNFERMKIVLNIIENAILYINSTGRKPWRATPLAKLHQKNFMKQLDNSYTNLVKMYGVELNPTRVDTPKLRLLTATFGSIEESLETVNSYNSHKSADILEEVTDEFFFFMEKLILLGITPRQLERQYYKKLEINLARYKSTREGDTSWDDRQTKEVL